MHYWDAQVWAVARLNQVPFVFSEDCNPGATLEGVRFVNPFAGSTSAGLPRGAIPMSTEPTYTHDTYLSPFTWRYGWRRCAALERGEQAPPLAAHLGRAGRGASRRPGWSPPSRWPTSRARRTTIDLARAPDIEAEIHHDLMAEVRTFAEQCPIGGGDHPPGRHLDGHRGQRRGAAPARGARPGAREAAPSCCWPSPSRSRRMPMRRRWPSPISSPPSRPRRATAWRSTPRTCWPTSRNCAAPAPSMRGKGFKGAVGTSASYASLRSEARARV